MMRRLNHKFMGTMFADKPVSGQEATWVGEFPCAGNRLQVQAVEIGWVRGTLVYKRTAWHNANTVTVSNNPVAGEVSMFHNIIKSLAFEHLPCTDLTWGTWNWCLSLRFPFLGGRQLCCNWLDIWEAWEQFHMCPGRVTRACTFYFLTCCLVSIHIAKPPFAIKLPSGNLT